MDDEDDAFPVYTGDATDLENSEISWQESNLWPSGY